MCTARVTHVAPVTCCLRTAHGAQLRLCFKLCCIASSTMCLLITMIARLPAVMIQQSPHTPPGSSQSMLFAVICAPVLLDHCCHACTPNFCIGTADIQAPFGLWRKTVEHHLQPQMPASAVRRRGPYLRATARFLAMRSDTVSNSMYSMYKSISATLLMHIGADISSALDTCTASTAQATLLHQQTHQPQPSVEDGACSVARGAVGGALRDCGNL